MSDACRAHPRSATARRRAAGTPPAADGRRTAATPDPTPGHAPARGIAFGAIAALVGAALIVVFGGALAVSAGLLVVASGGRLRRRAGHGRSGPVTRCRRGARPWIAAALAGLGVVLGQIGLWLFARAEGGVLPPIDYLGQTFGPLVPLEVLAGRGRRLVARPMTSGEDPAADLGDLTFRRPTEADHPRVVDVIDDWWGEPADAAPAAAPVARALQRHVLDRRARRTAGSPGSSSRS